MTSSARPPVTSAQDTRPPLQGVSHIALSAADLPAAHSFWTGVMGFEAMTVTPALLFVVERRSRVAIAVTSHDGAVSEAFDERRTGLDHLALAVPDAAALEAWQRHLAAHDVPYTPVVDSGSGLHLNLRAPGGIPVELYVIDEVTLAAFGLADATEASARPGV